MGFDLGIEQAGIEIAACVENHPRCCETIRTNRPHLPLFDRDIRTVTTNEMLFAAGLRVGEVFAVIGGPPCQSFCTGGKRQAITDHRGELFMEFIRVVQEASPEFFVFENVSQLLTAAVKHRPIAERPGQNWNLAPTAGNGTAGFRFSMAMAKPMRRKSVARSKTQSFPAPPSASSFPSSSSCHMN